MRAPVSGWQSSLRLWQARRRVPWAGFDLDQLHSAVRHRYQASEHDAVGDVEIVLSFHVAPGAPAPSDEGQPMITMTTAAAQIRPEIHHLPEATPTITAGIVKRMGGTIRLVSISIERYFSESRFHCMPAARTVLP